MFREQLHVILKVTWLTKYSYLVQDPNLDSSFWKAGV